MGVFVDEVEHPIFPPLVGTVFDEVIGPDMIGPLGAQTDAGSVVEPEPAPFGLPGGDFQPLAPPDPLDPFVVDDPACHRSQHFRDLPIAVAAILEGLFESGGGQPLPVVWAPGGAGFS